MKVLFHRETFEEHLLLLEQEEEFVDKEELKRLLIGNGIDFIDGYLRYKRLESYNTQIRKCYLLCVVMKP